MGFSTAATTAATGEFDLRFPIFEKIWEIALGKLLPAII
jgi:hypothetical protein